MARNTTRRVRSTGAAELPESPVDTTATPGRPESTGAQEPAHDLPVETRLPQLDAEFTVRQETPTEPFTTSVGWLSDEHSFEVATADAPAGAQAKVVKPAAKRGTPKSAKADPQTKGASGD